MKEDEEEFKFYQEFDTCRYIKNKTKCKFKSFGMLNKGIPDFVNKPSPYKDFDFFINFMFLEMR